MKYALKTLLAVAALGAASFANAVNIPSSGSVFVQNTNMDGDPATETGGGLGGGEFRATANGQVFYTFCVEKNQSISLPGTYNYELSLSVDSQPDVISNATAYLFRKFALGNLYTQDNSPAHDTAAGLLQAAIWYFENEVTNAWTYYDDWVVGNVFIAEAIAKFGGSAMDDYSGNHVRVMNLTNANGKKVQDILVAVPDSGMTLALLGLALTSVAIARRRRSFAG